MAHALVVYESMFGNTEAIAEEVVRGLSTYFQVSIREVGQAAHDVGDDVALVVVGAPTHASGCRGRAREDAGTKRDQPLVSQGDGLREWLATARPGRPGTPAAAFDTRSAHPRLPGSAARAAARRLRRRGFALGRAHTELLGRRPDRPAGRRRARASPSLGRTARRHPRNDRAGPGRGRLTAAGTFGPTHGQRPGAR